METKVVLAGVTAYNVAAKRQLAKQFKATGADREVILNEAKPTYFALRFPHTDKFALSTFVRLLQEFPEEVHGKSKFVRLRSTIAELEDDISESNESYKTEDSVLVGDNFIEKVWSTGIVAAHLANKIGSVTNCTIEQTLDSDGMLIEGLNEADVEKAIAKLDVVFKSSQQSFPIIRNYQVSEGEVGIYLQILPIGNLRDRLLTTLVPPHLVKDLSSQLIVVMMKGQQTLPLERPQQRGSFAIESVLWKDHSLPFFGQINTEEHTFDRKTSVEQPQAEIPRYRTLSQWVDESATAIPSLDPFVPLPDELKDLQIMDKKQAVGEVKEDVDTYVSPKKRPVKARKPKGTVQMTDMEATKDKVDEVFPLDTQLSTSQDIPVLSGRPEQRPEPSYTANTEAQPLYEASPDTSQENKGYLPTTTSTYYDDLWNIQPPHAPNILAPFMPARSIISEAPSNPNSEACWAQSGVSAATEGNLIGNLAPDAKQGNSRAQGSGNRRFKNTMNQRKPPGASGPNPGQSSVLKEYDDFAMYLLSLTQSRQGIVKLEVRIGRLMIDYQSGSTEFKQRPFAPGQWHDAFPNGSEMVKLESFMTERLTSLGSDIDFISQLKLHSNRNMFTPEPCERATFYRFTCASKLQSEDVIFDVYEDKTVHCRSMEILVGTLNIHFPKRYWDARIAVTVNDLIQDGHNDAIRETVAKLRIIPAADEGCIELDTDIDAKVLTFKSIELHRETCHRSTSYPDLLMKLSEIQDLHLDLSELDGLHNCRAFTKPKGKLIEDMMLWWEVSVASVAATKMLEENTTLEIGNTSTWKPSNITDALIVRNMSHLASDIVTRIDSVGCSNKGPKTTTSMEESEIAASNLGFW